MLNNKPEDEVGLYPALVKLSSLNPKLFKVYPISFFNLLIMFIFVAQFRLIPAFT